MGTVFGAVHWKSVFLHFFMSSQLTVDSLHNGSYLDALELQKVILSTALH
jgi:hypothetical protein